MTFEFPSNVSRTGKEKCERCALGVLQSKLCGAAYDWSTSQDEFVDLTVERALKKLKRAFYPPTQIQLEMELSSFTFKPNHDPNRF